jgi:uncharacterized protein (DUF58 family)
VPSAVQALRTRVGLTGRAWAFLACGLVLVLVGVSRGLMPAVQFGALVAALPVSAAVLTRGPRSSMELTRILSALELASDEELKVTVSVRGRFPRGRSLLLEDLAPPALGGGHRFALNASGQAISRPHYRVRVGARGVHHLGPMRIHVVDRFGMVHRTLTGGSRDEVLVYPRVVALDPVVLGGASLGSGSGHLGARGAATDDVIPREYHPGDEMRRIDWKASARTGALMVRSEESPWRSAVTVVLDLRETDHAGHEPDSAVDAALGLAASIGCLALEHGWDLTVVTTDDVPVFAGSPMTGIEQERRALLRALATVPISHVAVPSTDLRYSADSAASGPLVLIVGDVAPPSARLLAGIGAHSPQRLLVAVAADQWTDPRLDATRPASEATGADPRRVAESLDLFRAAGWRISRLERDTGVAAAWSGLVGPR